MKKIIVLLCLSLFFTSLNAQFIKHDINASYGIVTTDQILDVFENILITVFSFGSFEKDNYDYTGAKFISYKNALSYRFNLGLTLGYDNVSGDLLNTNVKIGDFRERHTTMAGELDLRWVKRDMLQMYTGIGLGYTFSNESGTLIDSGESGTNKSGHIAVQLNALGIRAGKSYGGFMEIGFGYKGILNFGLSYQFE